MPRNHQIQKLVGSTKFLEKTKKAYLTGTRTNAISEYLRKSVSPNKQPRAKIQLLSMPISHRKRR